MYRDAPTRLSTKTEEQTSAQPQLYRNSTDTQLRNALFTTEQPIYTQPIPQKPIPERQNQRGRNNTLYDALRQDLELNRRQAEEHRKH